MSWEKWTLLGLFAALSLISIARIGKPVKPSTPGSAVFVILINAGFAALVVFA